MQKLDQLNFENTFARLPDSFHSRLNPTPLPDPYLVSFNANAARLIDLDREEISRADFAEHFIGNRLLPGAEPLSMPYAGHQLGRFVPQLGDGRAILLGEIRNRAGELWDVQLKGAGTRPIRAAPMAAPFCAPASANTCVRKPCMDWASPPAAPCASSAAMKKLS